MGKWENKSRFLGELDISWEDINGMIENGDDGDSSTNSSLLPLSNLNIAEGLKNELPPFDLQKNEIQESFSGNPTFPVFSRNQEDGLSTIESVGSISDEDSVPVDEDSVCAENGDSGSEHQTSLGSLENKAQQRHSKIASSKIQNVLSEIEEEKLAILLNDTYLHNDRVHGEENRPKMVQNDCYGGNKHAEELRHLDSKLIEEGFCNDFGETSRVFYCRDGFSARHRRERVLVELADQRFLREKKRCINDALQQLKSFPLSLTGYNFVSTGDHGEIKNDIFYDSEHEASLSCIYKPLTQNDIRLMVADAEVELNGRRLLCHEEIACLLMEIMSPFIGASQHSSSASQ